MWIPGQTGSCNKWKVRPELSPPRANHISQFPHLQDETNNPSPAVPQGCYEHKQYVGKYSEEYTHVGIALSVVFCIFILKHIYKLLQGYPGTCLA